MNILIIVDKEGSAIDRLAQAIKKHNAHFSIEILAVHPKRADAETFQKLQKLLEWCDLIDVHYWKSGEVARQAYPDLFKAKKKIVCHFNPYDLEQMSWLEIYDAVTVGNNYMHNKLPYAKLIPYGVDLDFFEFNKDYTKEKRVNMTVARIESNKGVLEVAQACKDLGYEFHLVGRVSDANYMGQVMQYPVAFHENVDEQYLKEI